MKRNWIKIIGFLLLVGGIIWTLTIWLNDFDKAWTYVSGGASIIGLLLVICKNGDSTIKNGDFIVHAESDIGLTQQKEDPKKKHFVKESIEVNDARKSIVTVNLRNISTYSAKKINVIVSEDDICELVNKEKFPIGSVNVEGTFFVKLKRHAWDNHTSKFTIEFENVEGSYSESKEVDFSKL